MSTSIDRTSGWIVDPATPGPVLKALADVARDWRAVFGHNPVHTADAPVLIVMGAAAVRSVVGDVIEPLEPEAHRLEVRQLADGRVAVCAYGGSLRGDIYAIYLFSHSVLGVDPFWFWNDQPLAARTSIRVPSQDLDVKAPRFRYRGWFMNDEDLLTGWAPDPLGLGGISTDVWDRIFETVLRCGGNLVVPGTFIFPDEPQVALASQRGLVIGQHHIEVLGLNTFRWPDERPYSFATDRDELVQAWEACVLAYAESEVLWTVGYRGRHDRPFWYDDEAAAADDAGRGALISAAIAEQVAIVRRHRPHDDIVFNLWMEGVELWRAGHLQLPEGVIVVWPDDGHGVVLDHGLIAADQGIYYHTAMHDRIASQLTEMVEVGLIAQEFERVVAAGATEHVLINVSDVRPCVLTTSAAMELAWGAIADADRFYERWAEQQFGAELASRVGALWRDYFAAAWRYADGSPDRLEDNAYQTYARALLIDAGRGRFDDGFVFTDFLAHIPNAFVLMGERTVVEMAQLMFEGTSQAQPRWDLLMGAVTALRVEVDKNRVDFYDAHLATQVGIHQNSNAMLNSVAAACMRLAAGQSSLAVTYLDQAEAEGNAILSTLAAAERGRWVNWYAGEVFVDVPTTVHLIRTLRDRLVSGRWPIVDNERDVMRQADGQYNLIKAYQDGRSVQ